jgi:sterol desaturase/sphingolipid hydroxylase (fatty acid hydroxylase superfamily)
MMTFLIDTFDAAHQWLFETLVQPALFYLGASILIEDAYDATMWLLIGVLEITLLVVVVGALQRWRPAEAVTDKRQIRIDILYTLIHRLGLFRLGLYFTLLPVALWVTGLLHLNSFSVPPVDQIWPGVTDHAWVSLIIYLLIFDCVDYWYHRAQHRFGRFWALHAVHHSQRQMTMWSDNRNHLLDDLFHSLVLVMVSFMLGVPPGQFILVVVITQLLESFSHANIRMSFGRWGDRILVSPKFHRHHHSIRYDASTSGPAGGYNFAVLFPIWDMLFGTARSNGDYGPTGIHDQELDSGGRDYGQSFWAQQRLALREFFKGHTTS